MNTPNLLIHLGGQEKFIYTSLPITIQSTNHYYNNPLITRKKRRTKRTLSLAVLSVLYASYPYSLKSNHKLPITIQSTNHPTPTTLSKQEKALRQRNSIHRITPEPFPIRNNLKCLSINLNIRSSIIPHHVRFIHISRTNHRLHLLS